MTLLDKLYLSVYIPAVVVFGSLFVAHGNAVGWEVVQENWFGYLLIGIGGHCYFGMFYYMGKVGEMINEL